MNFKEALGIVINEAEVSAIGNRDDTQLETLKACEVVKQFLKYLPSSFTNDPTPNKIKNTEYSDFCDDAEKMLDFVNLSKEEFLKSYSYIHELEYNATRSKMKESNEY